MDVEEGGVEMEEGVEVVDVVEEGGVQGEMLVKGSSKTRTKLRGAITTGSGATTRRWRERDRHLHNVLIGTPVRCKAIKTRL